MSFRETDLAGEVALLYSSTGPTSFFGGSPITGIHKWSTNAVAEITAIVAALGSDATVHDQTIEARSATLTTGEVNAIVAPAAGWKSRLGNDLILLVNAAKGGGLSNSQIISAIDDAVGVAHAPAVIDVPFVSGASVRGSVLTCTQGNWVGTPTGYAYAWKRNGAVAVGTNANTYTTVVADVGAAIGCVVTATNATGSTPAPISNTIVVT